MKKISISFLGILIFVLSCNDKVEETAIVAPIGSPAAPPVSTPSGDRIVTEEWLKDLDTPWQIVFAKDGRTFFTERPGRIRVVRNGVMYTWLDLSNIVEQGESGLLGIGLDPNFEQNGYVYIAYTYSTSQFPFVNRLVRCVEDRATGRGREEKILLDNINGLQNHNGGPIKFGPDGKMYWTVGDGFDLEKPQVLTNLNGKVLRLNLDGSIPSDNPFPNSYIWTYGNRNVQGLDWQPGTNNLFATEHGPTFETGCCNDEINIIEKGKNYGWPLIKGMERRANMETPIFTSGTDKTWAPAGATFIRNGKWRGSFVFVGLRGYSLYRAVIDPNNPRVVLRVEEYLNNTFGRLRDVAEASDGTLYVCVSNRDGRGTPRAEDDKIIKVRIE
ncbi:MAG: PQQ-dependent sugar dehydrogenase [Leadbetterella sp.]